MDRLQVLRQGEHALVRDQRQDLQLRRVPRVIVHKRALLGVGAGNGLLQARLAELRGLAREVHEALMVLLNEQEQPRHVHFGLESKGTVAS